MLAVGLCRSPVRDDLVGRSRRRNCADIEKSLLHVVGQLGRYSGGGGEVTPVEPIGGIARGETVTLDEVRDRGGIARELTGRTLREGDESIEISNAAMARLSRVRARA